jgi:hypothetical protein
MYFYNKVEAGRQKMNIMQAKKWEIGILSVFFVLSGLICGSTGNDQMSEYRIVSIDSNQWIMEAKEVKTGQLVKLRLNPKVFVGQTFNFLMRDLKPGQLMSVQGPANAQLSLTFVERRADKRSRLRQDEKIRRPVMLSPPLTWEIMEVDPKQWIVLARNRTTQRQVKLKVHPEAFNGFLILIDNGSIGQGEGLKVVSPNRQPMKNCCTLLENIEK